MIVFENQTTSDSLSVDHNVDTPYPQDLEEETVTDLSISETQKLIEPDKAGSKDNNLNTAASLEDEINPPSDDQGEVIINAHASSSGPECLKGNSQPESSPAPSTDQHITESEEPPSQLNSQFSAVRVEEQTVINGTSDPSELISPTVDKEFENGGHISDGTIDREGEGEDRRAESTEHIETSGSLNPPLNDNGEKQGTSIASELSLSADQKSEDRGCISDDMKDRESELERSANSTEYRETEEPPLPSNAICTQLNSNGEGEFEEGDSVSDDANKTGREGDKSDKSALPDEATSELPVILKGREEQASGELLSLPDQDNADNNSDIEGEEKVNGTGDMGGEGNSGKISLQVINHSSGLPDQDNADNNSDTEGEEKVNGTGDMEGKGNSGEISLQVINHSSGLPSEIDSSALESGNPTEVIHSHDIDQHQQHKPSDSANPFDHEKQEVGKEDTLPLNSDPDVIHPMDMPVSPILPAVVVPETEATEDHTEDLSSVPCDAAEESSEPPEEINEVEENFSQTNKDDFERISKKFEHAMDQEGIEDHLESRETKGDKGDGDCKVSAKELKYVVDEEDVRDHLETEELSGDDSKHKFEAPVPAKELECTMDQKDIGDHHEIREINVDKEHSDFEEVGKKLGDQEDIKEQFETRESGYHLETSRDKGEDLSNDHNQLPDPTSFIDHDFGDEKHTAVHLGSMAELEGSLTSYSTKSTSGQSELSSKGPASDLNTSSSSQEVYTEENEMSTETGKPIDLDDTLFSQEEVAPIIKCTFVGRTIKTVARTSADTSINLESSDAKYSESIKKSSIEGIITNTDTVVENGDDSPLNNEALLGIPMHVQESKIGSVLTGEKLTESPLGQKMTNKTLPPLDGAKFNAMEFISKEKERAEASELQTSKQKFPYKFETVV